MKRFKTKEIYKKFLLFCKFIQISFFLYTLLKIVLFAELKYKMQLSTIDHNQVLKMVETNNIYDSKKGTIGFLKSCKNHSKQRTNVLKLGQIYFNNFLSDFLFTMFHC